MAQAKSLSSEFTAEEAAFRPTETTRTPTTSTNAISDVSTTPASSAKNLCTGFS